jgi:hypothetical protein
MITTRQIFFLGQLGELKVDDFFFDREYPVLRSSVLQMFGNFG